MIRRHGRTRWLVLAVAVAAVLGVTWLVMGLFDDDDVWHSVVTAVLDRPLLMGVTVFGLPLLAALTIGPRVWRAGRDISYRDAVPGLSPAEGGGTTERGDSPPTIVRFTPPENIEPAMASLILQRRADTGAVAATVVDLAVRGLLVISPIKGTGWTRGLIRPQRDWLLKRQSTPASESLRPFEDVVYSALFRHGKTIELSALRRKLSGQVERARLTIEADGWQRGWFTTKPWALRGLARLPLLLLLPVAVVAFLSDWSIALAVWVVAACVGIGLTYLTIRWLTRRLPGRTAQGSLVYAQCLGFREYLTTADAEQIRWEEAQDLFSRYLPYAAVFGVADRWASTFDRVASAAARAGHSVGSPWWFGGNDGQSLSDLVGSIDTFAATASGTMSATPWTGWSGSDTPTSASSSLGASGFDIGSAGGGVGGGGGGSW